jgi:plastocyanin domain-containing protein
MKKTLITTIAVLGLIWTDRAIAQEPFQRIEQPLANRAIVTIGGIGLIGLELWWFSKPHSRR